MRTQPRLHSLRKSPTALKALPAVLRALASALLVLSESTWAAELRIQIDHRWNQSPLALGTPTNEHASGEPITPTRLAYLLSHAKLQRSDTRWIGAENWSAYIDPSKQRTSFLLSNIPEGRYRALRFDLGLDPHTDSSDPAARPPGHPLHPELNGLHWGWRGGYVFLAFEGRRTKTNAGFSYHLGGPQARGTVEIPAEFELKGPWLVTLAFDADRLLSTPHSINPDKESSTHSREEDPLTARLADNAVAAFSLVRVGPDTEPDNTPKWIDALPAKTDWDARIPAYVPRPSWPADNLPSNAGIALGKKLFHDTRLSINNSQSCASCHHPAFAMADPRPLSAGAEGHPGSRNAMALFNLAWKNSFFWDGRTKSLRDQVLEPIQDPREMRETLPAVLAKLSADPAYPSEFSRVFGSPTITSERLALALEQFLLAQLSWNSKFDRAFRGEAQLSQEERRGFELFFSEYDPRIGRFGADCFHCHGGADFSNHDFANNGLTPRTTDPDLGRFLVTGKPEDRGRFAVPSLRNVALTAPYMHDGRFHSLEEVVAHYDHGIVRSPSLDPNLAKHPPEGINLSPEDQKALVAFLRSLTDADLAPATP